MNMINETTLRKLMSENGLCLSLYMPTHRHHPENLQDPIRFKNLLKELKDSATKMAGEEKANALLAPLDALAEKRDFWNHTLDGLAIFHNENMYQVYLLPITVKEYTTVANSFHIKPLHKYAQTKDRFNVLALSLHDFKVYEGNRHGISEITIDGMPQTIKEVLGDELTDKHLRAGFHSGTSTLMHHGHGSKADEMPIDAERFFRAVSKLVYENISKESGLPLIVAALPEHHALYQKVGANHLLVKDGVMEMPYALSLADLATKAWEVLEPAYIENLNVLSDSFKVAEAAGKGSAQIADVARAAAQGRVDTLLVDAHKTIPGNINRENGFILSTNADAIGNDDLLDDLIEMVSEKGGKTIVALPDYMPADSGLAATYRY